MDYTGKENTHDHPLLSTDLQQKLYYFYSCLVLLMAIRFEMDVSVGFLVVEVVHVGGGSTFIH